MAAMYTVSLSDAERLVLTETARASEAPRQVLINDVHAGAEYLPKNVTCR
jgi:hypothetical protein